MATFAATTRTMTEFATSVRDARLAAGMSQAELAEAANLTRSWVSLFESGRTPNASLSKVLAMLDVLGVTVRVTYSVPDPEEHVDERHHRKGPSASVATVPEDITGDSRSETSALLDPAALAVARGLRSVHRARALADEQS